LVLRNPTTKRRSIFDVPAVEAVFAAHQKGPHYPSEPTGWPVASAAGLCQKPTMVDADDLPPKCLECLTRPAPRRGYLAGISSSGAVLSRRSMASADHKMRRLQSSEPQVLTA
jgi:hypothetical protein